MCRPLGGVTPRVSKVVVVLRPSLWPPRSSVGSPPAVGWHPQRTSQVMNFFSPSKPSAAPPAQAAPRSSHTPDSGATAGVKADGAVCGDAQMFGLAAAAASNAAPASNRTFGTTTPQAQAYDPATSSYLHALHRQADRLLPSDLDSGGGVGAGARVQINMDSLAQAMASGGEISYDDARQIVRSC